MDDGSEEGASFAAWDAVVVPHGDGSEGLEVDPERRLRFLTHGLLLEYKVGDRIVVHPAPLLAGILARSRAA
jgi:hypothetical protein